MAEISYDDVQEYLSTLVPPREPELQAMERLAEQKTFQLLVRRADIIVINWRG